MEFRILALSFVLLFTTIVVATSLRPHKKDPEKTAAKTTKGNVVFHPDSVVKMAVFSTDSATVHFGDTLRFGVAMAVMYKNERYSFLKWGNSIMLWGKSSDLQKSQLFAKTYLNKSKHAFFWNDFDIKVEGGVLIDSNAVVVGKTLTDCPGGHITVTLTYKRKDGFTQAKKFDLISNKHFVLNFNGRNGFNGYNGNSGSSGASAINDTPCQNGSHGNHGQDGQNGYDGHNVDIYIRKEPGKLLDKDLYQIHVHDLTTGYRRNYIIDAASSSLSVYANGGNGGNGGDGGRGGDGGEDNRNSQNRERCLGGNGGDGGNGANGGNGGQIRIFADTSVNITQLQLRTYNYGGKTGIGGNAGRAGDGMGTRQSSQRRNNAAIPGRPGRNGYQGMNGPRIETVVQPLSSNLFTSL